MGFSTLNDFDKVIETTSAFRVLADPTRCRIICTLAEATRDLCVNDIAAALDISHSAASHQLAKLEARGIVHGERHGQTICYTLTKSPLTRNLLRVLQIFAK